VEPAHRPSMAAKTADRRNRVKFMFYDPIISVE